MAALQASAGRMAAVGLAEVARRRGGVFTSADVAAAGVPRGQARTLVRQGRWIRVGRGVYAEADLAIALADEPQARHALDVAAALAGTDDRRFAVAQSAAAVLGLETLHPSPARVTLGTARDTCRGHGFRGPAVRTLVAATPPEHLVAAWDSLATTSPARTAVDLARSDDLAAGVVALDSAARQFGCLPGQLREVAVHQEGWPYARRLARALALTDDRSESVLESLGRLALCGTALPRPLCQVWLGERRAEFRVDLLLPGLWVVGEADGRLKYTSPATLWQEKRRQDRLEDLGFTVVRFDWAEASTRPRRLADRFVAAVARARPGPGRVFPDPAWWVDQRARAWDRALAGPPWWLRDQGSP